MKKILIAVILFTLLACDDGDVITSEFDFDDTAVSACTPVASNGAINYVFYKNSTANQESLLLSFASTEDIAVEGYTGTFALDDNNIFEYRRFNAAATAAYFCGLLPPTEPEIVETFEGTDGSILISTIRIDDDEDGIPTFLEMGEDNTALDTDGDGIPNHLDIDDDGDNVPTIDEGVVIVDGVVSREESQNTDNDDQLDYLDMDDDGDGVPTKQEATGADINPQNYPTLNADFPNYLNDAVSEAADPRIEERIVHTFFTFLQIDFNVTGFNFTDGSEEIRYETFEFGQIEVNRAEVDAD